jgi:hypothetical protein
MEPTTLGGAREVGGVIAVTQETAATRAAFDRVETIEQVALTLSPSDAR